ncbi:MAG: hypothetical protein IKE53_07870 [Clostridiales bacterium]|nr:hypothetical protein [Clostridiales bacterium]
MKDTLLLLLKTTAIIIVSAIAGLALLCLVYAFVPEDRIEENVKGSIVLISSELDTFSHYTITDICTSGIDSYTDPLMLLIASDDTEDTLTRRALLNYWKNVDFYAPGDSLAAHYIFGLDFNEPQPYPQYWHGYLVILKPLLFFFDYSGVRMVNAIIQILSTSAVVTLMYLKKKKGLIIPYLINYLMMMPMAISMCMQFSSCFYIYTAGTAVCLLVGDDEKKSDLLFLMIGIFLAFFDFLTYPVITLGIPLITYVFIVMQAEELSWKRILITTIRKCVIWAYGYAGMWIAKWILGTLFTDINVLKMGILSVMFRSGDATDDTVGFINRFKSVGTGLKYFFYTPASLLFAVYVIGMIIVLTTNRKRLSRNMVSGIIPFLMICMIPLAWFFLAANHTLIHYYFTNKAAAVLTYGIMVIPTLLFYKACDRKQHNRMLMDQ